MRYNPTNRGCLAIGGTFRGNANEPLNGRVAMSSGENPARGEKGGGAAKMVVGVR